MRGDEISQKNFRGQCGNTANSVFRNYIFFGQLFFSMTQQKTMSLSLLAANVAG